MPTLPAAGYAYQPFPSATPSTGAPQSYQRIQSSPADFGSLEGQAIGQLGQTLEQAGGRIATSVIEEQVRHNETAAQEAQNALQAAVNSLMYGDDTNPGYLAAQGKAALEGFGPLRDNIIKLRDEQRKLLQNDQQRRRFDAEANNLLNMKMNEAGRHRVQERNQWEIGVAKGTAALAAQTADKAAALNDPVLFATATADGARAMRTTMEKIQAPPEQIEAAINDYRRDRAVMWAGNVAVRDPTKAREFAEANRALLGDKFSSVMDSIRIRADEQEASRLANSVSGQRKVGDPAIVTGIATRLKARGWTDEAIEGALNNGQDESGFNPLAIGKAGEKGIWQFHPKSHEGPFVAKYKTWEWQNQTDYMAEVVEQTMPNYKNITNGRQATAEFLRGFEQPKDQSDAVVARRAANALNPKTFGTTAPPISLRDARQEIESSSASPEVKDRAIRKLEQIIQADRSDEAYQRQRKQQADREADDAVEMQYNRLIAAKDPTVTAQSILADARWRSPEAAQRMVSFYERSTKPDPDPNVDARNHAELFRRITLPDGDPQKITTREPIDQEFIRQGIKQSTRDDLYRIVTANVPGSSAQQILTNTSRMVTSVEPLLRPYKSWGAQFEDRADPTAGQREMNYRLYVQARAKELADAGKSPLVLFQSTIGGRENPDYIGSPALIKELFAPPEIQVKNGAKDTPAQQRQQVDDFTTVDGLKRAFNAGRINRQTLIEKARILGYDLVDQPLGAPIAR